MSKQDKYTTPKRIISSEPVQINAAEDVYIPSADEQLEKVQSFYKKNERPIQIGLIALVVLVGGYFFYTNFQKPKTNEKANEALAMANTYMLIDSTNYMLNGAAGSKGAQAIAKEYSSTDAGNIAKYMAGVGNLKNGKYKEAINYLKDFDGKGTLLGTLAKGCLGDAYLEDNQLEKAIECYNQAGADNDNFQYSPTYLQRAAMVYEKLNKKEDAIRTYKTIKEKFGQSSAARDVDISLAKLGVVED